MQAKLHTSGRARGLTYDPLAIAFLRLHRRCLTLIATSPLSSRSSSQFAKFFRQQMLDSRSPMQS
jgi:hypothetical protein